MTDEDWLSIGPYDQPILTPMSAPNSNLHDFLSSVPDDVGPQTAEEAIEAVRSIRSTPTIPREELLEKLEAAILPYKDWDHPPFWVKYVTQSLEVLRACLAELKRGEAREAYLRAEVIQDRAQTLYNSDYGPDDFDECQQRAAEGLHDDLAAAMSSTAAKEGE